MNKQVFEITEEGLKKIQVELDQLKTVDRPNNITAIQEARAQGDLSENADYDAARNDQVRIEQRILELENILKNHQIISTTQSNVVAAGTIVTLLNKNTNKQTVYHIVGAIESNPLEQKISTECPLGQAILGASVGDVKTVRPESRNDYQVEVLEIKN
ncbi:MAG: transcription elongation factor GreA [bacterium]